MNDAEGTATVKITSPDGSAERMRARVEADALEHHATAERLVEQVELARLKPSPTQYRKTFTGIDELAVTIKAHGILQPLLVRALKGTDLEIVYGERRFRAAKLAGLTHVPVEIRELTDLDVVELQLIENVQRVDVPAIEQADGYRILAEKHGYSVERIAAKVGTSKGTIYGRLKLCALGKAGREALAAGKLTDSTALYVARLHPSVQTEAVKALMPRFTEDQTPISDREARRIIHQRFLLRLSEAQFNPKDTTLVEKAGACSACPKRSGNAPPELFPDVTTKDVCTDVVCFNAKTDAAWKALKHAAKIVGHVTEEGKRAKAYFPYTHGPVLHTTGLVELGSLDHNDPKRRTYEERYGAKLGDEPRTFVRTDDGKVHTLVDAKAIKRLQPKRAPDVDSLLDRAKTKKQNETEKLKSLAEVAGIAAARAAIGTKLSTRELDKAIWRALIESEIEYEHGQYDALLESRGLTIKTVHEAFDRMPLGELRGLYIECSLASEHVGRVLDGKGSALAAIAKHLKIDIKACIATELARLKAEGKPKK